MTGILNFLGDLRSWLVGAEMNKEDVSRHYYELYLKTKSMKYAKEKCLFRCHNNIPDILEARSKREVGMNLLLIGSYTQIILYSNLVKLVAG